MSKTIAEMSIDTRLIVERMEKAEIGEVVTYDELSSIIGKDVRGVYHFTTTARKRLLKKKMYFEAVKGVGFKRCNDSQKVAGGATYIQKSRRACTRGVKITSSVDDYDAMSKEDQVRHNSQLSLMLTMRSITTANKIKDVERRVETAQQSLSLAATLQALSGHSTKTDDGENK